MTIDEWRALIAAYLEARISPEAFARRFAEAFAADRQRGTPILAPIVDLQIAVEAFAAEAGGRDIGATPDDDLRDAARRTETLLREAILGETGAPGPTRTFYDRSRAREDMRRIQIQMSGCAGLGCLFGLVWVVLCLIQIIFVSDWVQQVFGFSAWPSAVIGFFLAFVPIVGNVLAFLDATQYRQWPAWLAAVIFFAAPAATLFSGWMRWRRYRG